VEKNGHAPTLRCNTHGNLPIVCTEAEKLPSVTMRIRQGCDGGGKGALWQTEKSGTLATGNDQTLFCAATTQVNAEIYEDLCPTVTAAAGHSGNNKPYVAYGFDLQQITSKTNRSSLKEVQPSLCAAGNPHIVHPDVTGTLCASGAGLSRPGGMGNETDLYVSYCLQGNMIGRQDKNGPQGRGINEEVSFTLSATDHHAVASVDCRNLYENNEISGTLQSKNKGGYALNSQNPVRTGYIVRRLTPTEAERLMSLPDDWTKYGHDGKLMSDSARYQFCGNSIVVNVLAYIMQNIAQLLGTPGEVENDTI
jgi:DNA (cytosine-5)-methyltransferase 1